MKVLFTVGSGRLHLTSSKQANCGVCTTQAGIPSSCSSTGGICPSSSCTVGNRLGVFAGVCGSLASGTPGCQFSLPDAVLGLGDNSESSSPPYARFGDEKQWSSFTLAGSRHSTPMPRFELGVENLSSFTIKFSLGRGRGELVQSSPSFASGFADHSCCCAACPSVSATALRRGGGVSARCWENIVAIEANGN